MTLGKFITLEGGEGTGKSTQTRILAEKLRKTGLTVVATREPGGTDAGEAIRNLLLNDALGDITPLTEALLFSAARSEHIAKKIAPNLLKGHWVISDRFMDSTRAYQGTQGGLQSETIDTLQQIVVAEHIPDLTILLDLPAEEGLARAQSRHNQSDTANGRDRFEARDLEFHEALRHRFIAIAEEGNRRMEVIDASKGERAVANAVWRAVKRRLID